MPGGLILCCYVSPWAEAFPPSFHSNIATMFETDVAQEIPSKGEEGSGPLHFKHHFTYTFSKGLPIREFCPQDDCLSASICPPEPLPQSKKRGSKNARAKGQPGSGPTSSLPYSTVERQISPRPVFMDVQHGMQPPQNMKPPPPAS